MMDGNKHTLFMKTLFLLRHAKSSWEFPSLSDFERPLNERGRRTAPFMGHLMKERGICPAVIICSPAVRARETAIAVKSASDLICEIVFESGVYEASPNVLRKIIENLKDTFASAMLVGHNPGMEGIIYYLTGRVEPMPTAALAIVELDVDKWSDTLDGSGTIVEIIRPKEEMYKSD
jgi:phosphohistidine phosphatase